MPIIEHIIVSYLNIILPTELILDQDIILIGIGLEAIIVTVDVLELMDIIDTIIS